ncbi:hypothetical protein [Pseudodesulfovibrio sp. zrk46]|uniref:hypothetical protein n=1 Tax=Pseudodesulfovibrio sp. zrk46 TaxID=2725288 RepID=UPI001448A7BA|nr:hypothetical protein [Pseudodesulfovibrio sp. zrk46]QJB55602.1 hypothetical protein HFN16_03965 [Pseudodesulfovibrio sp. zrk46]
MIRTGKTEHFDHDVIQIDLADSRHRNRVLNFIEWESVTGDFEYRINAQWTNAQYHPTMHMSEDDLIALANELNKWVAKIQSRRG